MPRYRRADTPGSTYFFTVNTYRRQRFLIDEDVRGALREGIVLARATRPFVIRAWVLLPDHMHCLWELPEGDADFSLRWAVIKRHVTQRCGARLKRTDWLRPSAEKRGENTLWQRRFWEHRIRDDLDFERHADYIHWNPVKHKYVARAADWPFSSFHRFVESGIYSSGWCGVASDAEAVFGE